MQKTITLTFGEQAENHRGMQVLGEGLAPLGFSLDTLNEARNKFVRAGCQARVYSLNEVKDTEPASILVVKNGAKALTHSTADALFEEQLALEWDTKAFMYGRVVNKKARYNLCYGDVEQSPNYEEKQGRVVPWSEIPLTRQIRENLPKFLGAQAEGLQAEGNLYYDITKCGIGFHGDTERRLVVAVRLGAPLPIHYQWFQEGKPIGPRMVFQLNHGDVYVMSQKATGHDWKKRKIPTLRHATGCEKFTKK